MKYPLYIVSINKAGSSRIRQINGVMVIVLTSSGVDPGSNQSSVKPNTIKLVISAEYVPSKRT